MGRNEAATTSATYSQILKQRQRHISNEDNKIFTYVFTHEKKDEHTAKL